MKTVGVAFRRRTISYVTVETKRFFTFVWKILLL